MQEQDKLVEKLALQVASFQEGFELLIKATNFSEMTKTFAHLLRGNFVLKSIHLFHKADENSEWEKVGLDLEIEKEYFLLLEPSDKFNLKYLENSKYSSVVILPLSDDSCLGIILGKKLNGENLSVLDKITLQILLQVFDSAHKAILSQKKVKKLLFELNEKVFQLNNLVDTGIELSKFEKRNALFQIALERLSSITNSSSALVKIEKLNEPDNTQFYTFPESTKVDEISKSERKVETSFKIGGKKYSIILSAKETRKGLTEFNALDITLLNAISRQLLTSIENDYLHKQSLEKEKMEKELNVAASIQQQIIPQNLPEIPGYEIDGRNIPSREVGGDYYDCIKLKDGRFALVIADVAGKGISAALLVNTLNAALYSYLEFEITLSEMAEKLNALIYKVSPPDKFITFIIAVLDPTSGNLDIVNAGHNPILIWRKNKIEKIDAGSVGLGMFDFSIPFIEQKIQLSQGETLFLYTDGIPEAMNELEEEYSDERMINFFEKNQAKEAKEFIVDIFSDVKSFTKEAIQSDDITAIILKRN